MSIILRLRYYENIVKRYVRFYIYRANIVIIIYSNDLIIYHICLDSRTIYVDQQLALIYIREILFDF